MLRAVQHSLTQAPFIPWGPQMSRKKALGKPRSDSELPHWRKFELCRELPLGAMEFGQQGLKPLDLFLLRFSSTSHLCS